MNIKSFEESRRKIKLSEEYPEKLAEYIDKLDFNNMDFAEEMKGIWDLAQKEIISKFVKRIDDVIGECQNYTQYFEELIIMKEYYEEML